MWGNNASGQIGDGTTVSKSSPVQIGVPVLPTGYSLGAKVLAGSNFSGMVINNNLFTWGRNNNSQLGDGTTVDKSTPVQINSSGSSINGSVLNASLGENSSLAIRTDGILFAWGINSSGQLGDGTTVNKSTPVQIGNSSWIVVSAGFNNNAAIRSGGTLFTWGSNSAGELGDGTTNNKSSPVQIGSDSWTMVSTNNGSSLAIRSDGLLFTWGNNSYGQLGDGTTVNKSSPVQIGSSSWTAIKGGYSSFAIRTDGILFAWGRNNFGQLGDGTTVNKSQPVQIGSSSWAALSITAPSDTMGAIRSGGTLFTWGRNQYGQLGDGTTVNKSSPVQIGSSNWTMLAMGKLGQTFANTSDGTLYVWGAGSFGQLGINDTTNRSSPTQFTMGVWSQLWVTTSGTTAILSSWATYYNKRAYVWGVNSLTFGGRLGLNDTINRSSPSLLGGQPVSSNQSSPVQVASNSWNAVDAGSSHVMALNSANILFTWGLNSSGQLGDGT
ncbi:MAG: RCC1 repeat-containing protein, partial [Actinobacteria bacterium]|nr:RCC1 repeat-containing protein [Actinomycetota bacterium]